MKLRLRTLVSGSKIVEHAKYNLSYQFTSDAMKHLQVEEVPQLDPDARQVIAEAYILNAADRVRLTELLGRLATAALEASHYLAEISHIIGFSETAEPPEGGDLSGWDELPH